MHFKMHINVSMYVHMFIYMCPYTWTSTKVHVCIQIVNACKLMTG